MSITSAHVDAIRAQIRAAGVDCKMSDVTFDAFVGPEVEDGDGKTREFAAELENLPFVPSFGDPIVTPEGEYHFEDAEIGFGLVVGTLT